MRKLSIILLSLFIFRPCLGQTKPNAEYYLPKTFSKPDLWIKANKLREVNSNDDSNYKQNVVVTIPSGRIARKLTLSDYLNMIRYQSDFYTFISAKNWVIKNYDIFFPYLISFLTDQTIVGLTDSTDSDIPPKDFELYKNGNITRKNLITVSGRATFILNELTGEYFAIATPSTTTAELINYQKLWVAWIRKLK